MNLGMSMNLTQRQRLECTVCDHFMDEHAEGCPQEALEKLCDSVKRWNCPTCGAMSLRLNVDDVFECEKQDCRALWCSGMGFGDPPDDAERSHVFSYTENEATAVYRMAWKGSGVFRETATIKILQAQVNDARKNHKRRMAARRRRAREEDDNEMIQDYYTVSPRFTPGSPAQTRREIAEQVTRGERRAIEDCRDGDMGADLALKAQQLGLGNIVLHVEEFARRWDVTDLLTGETWERQKKYKKGARVEVWDERVGWVSAKVERCDDIETTVVRDDQQPWEKTVVNRLNKLRLKSSVKVPETTT